MTPEEQDDLIDILFTYGYVVIDPDDQTMSLFADESFVVVNCFVRAEAIAELIQIVREELLSMIVDIGK